MLRRLLRVRLGEVPDLLDKRIATAGETELAALLGKALNASSAEELLER